MRPLCRSTTEVGSANFHAPSRAVFWPILRDFPQFHAFEPALDQTVGPRRPRLATIRLATSLGLEFFVADENNGRSMRLVAVP